MNERLSKIIISNDGTPKLRIGTGGRVSIDTRLTDGETESRVHGGPISVGEDGNVQVENTRDSNH